LKLKKSEKGNVAKKMQILNLTREVDNLKNMLKLHNIQWQAITEVKYASGSDSSELSSLSDSDNENAGKKSNDTATDKGNNEEGDMDHS